jgi:hypothetical protein
MLLYNQEPLIILLVVRYSLKVLPIEPEIPYMAQLLPFNISYLILTPRRVRLPGESLSSQSPEKPQYV